LIEGNVFGDTQHPVPDRREDMIGVFLAGQLHVETPGLQAEQAGQQLGVINLRAVGGIVIAAGAGMRSSTIQRLAAMFDWSSITSS
jgi:hypothetical protein